MYDGPSELADLLLKRDSFAFFDHDQKARMLTGRMVA
jgi:hypothetical protein